jgi:hypothetical protein
VDTSTLKVDSTNNRVGIGTASPARPLDIVGSFQSSLGWVLTGTPAGLGAATRYIGGASTTDSWYYNGVTGGSHIWAFGESTAMTLNSTGLGVGGAPSDGRLLTIGSLSSVSATASAINIYSSKATLNITADGATNAAGTTISYSWANGGQGPLIFRNASIANVMTLDSSGNVGVGVTPSATDSTYFQALEIARVGQGLTAAKNALTGSPSSWLSNNSYATYSSGVVWNYAISQPAAQYRLFEGQHQWFNAPSGTAGNAITFTQAMTLAANGQLLLGTTSTSGVVDTAMVMDKSSGSGFVGNVYRMGGVDKGYSYLSSASASMLYETVTGYVIRMVSATNGVYLANGGTSWLTISDERNKDIIEPISNAVAKVGSLRSVIGKFKSETEGTRRSFLIAQDVQAVLPEAVDSTNPNELAVSYTDVIPLLVAAIKELTAEVNALKKA